MRRICSGSFLRLSSFTALWRAWRMHSRGKRRRGAVARYQLDADSRLLRLGRALRDGSYRPHPYRQHLVREPKLRLISAPSVRDRVLQQAIVTELEPTFTRSYIHDSYACLPGRGPQRALLRHLGWMRRYRFRLSLDVARYFMSVRYQTLLDELVFPRLRDEATRELLRQLFSHGADVYCTRLARRVVVPPPPAGVGMPIGSSLSQWAANLYLDGADHFIKRQLKVRAYLRYMDDFTLFDDDAERLVMVRDAIAQWLLERRQLTLKLTRWQVCPTTDACTFLGYRVSRAGLVPGRAMRRRLNGKLAQAAVRGPEAFERSLAAYVGLFSL